MNALRAVCIMCVLAASTLEAAEAPAGRQALPDQVVLCARVGNMEAWDGAVQDLVSRLVPGAPVVGPMADSFAVAALLTADRATVDLTAPIYVVLMGPPMLKAPVMVFSVTDADAYRASLLVEQERTEGDLVVYDQGGVPFVLGIVGTRAAAGNNLEAVKAVLGFVRDGQFAAGPAEEGAHGTITVRLRKLLDELAAAGQDPFEAMAAALSDEISREANPMSEKIASVLQAEIDAVGKIARQLDVIALDVSLGPEEILLASHVEPVAGSGLAAYVASIPGGKLTTLERLPAGGLVVLATKYGDLGDVIRWYEGFVKAMMRPEQGATEVAGSLTAMASKWLQVSGNEASISFGEGADGALSYVAVTAVKDAPSLEELVKTVPELMHTMAEMQKDFGVTMDLTPLQDVPAYKGHKITGWRWDIKMVPIEGMPGGEEMAQMQNDILKQLYGENIESYWTLLGDVAAYTQGSGALDVLKGIIDGQDPTAAGSDWVKAAMADAPGEPIAVGRLDLPPLIGWYMGILAKAMPMMPAQFAALKFPEAPPVIVSVRRVEGSIDKRVHVPVAALKSLVDGFTGAFFAPPEPMEGGAEDGDDQ